MQQQQQQPLKEVILNLDDVINKFAEAVYEKTERKDLEKALGCRLPWQQLRKEIDIREMLLCTAVPNYCSESATEDPFDSDAAPLVLKPEPLVPERSSSCLFKTEYTNSSGHEVVNTINTTRTTRATCSLRVTRGFVLNRQVGVTLSLPQQILAFNAGFSCEMSTGEEAEKTVETEMQWSVNTEVRVPPRRADGAASRVAVEINVEEKEFKAKFSAVTYLSGRVKVRLFTRDGDSLCVLSISDLRRVFTESLGFKHAAGSSKVAFVCAGRCRSRFGVSQSICVTPLE